MLKTNEDRIAKFRLQGSIIPPYGFGWEVGHDGKPRILPSVGGITLNFKLGDLANHFVADHLEPAVSTTMEAGFDGKANSTRNKGYNIFSCIGNEALVIGGKAKGKRGRVTGHHGGCEHVIIDFDDDTLNKLTYDDKIMITAHGAGLELTDYKDVVVYSLDPGLMKLMNIKESGRKIEIGVTTMIPAVVMGSGLGSIDSYKGDYDIQTSDPVTNLKYGLDKLRLGDVVAIIDHDASFGWSYKPGAVSIGIVIHGDSTLAGHGPGVQTIMTCLGGTIVPKIDTKANIGRYLKIGRYRK